jgi:3-ketosteroid 9alpha-monooxygenase subunit A
MAKTADYGLGTFTFPRGWFIIATAAELTDKPLAVRFFGQDFALYRGKSGKAILLDAYCPHMGTHLTKNTSSYVVHDGQIEGDSIRCPYHAWRFGPDGKCDHIPYYDGPIPKAAQVRSYPVREELGCVWIWYDAEGGEPDYDVPTLPEWHDPSWVRWDVQDLGVLPTHGIEIVDNMTDIAHQGPVHGLKTLTYFENEYRGHIVTQRLGGRHRTLGVDTDALETLTWYTGPGVLLSRMNTGLDSITMISHTHVDDGSVRVWYGVMVKSPHAVATEADVATAREYQELAKAAFAQDFDVWANKRPALQILQIPTDGPYDKNRLWYRQFYNPRSEARKFLDRIEGLHYVPGTAGMPKAAE